QRRPDAEEDQDRAAAEGALHADRGRGRRGRRGGLVPLPRRVAEERCPRRRCHRRDRHGGARPRPGVSQVPQDDVFAGEPDAFGRLWTPHRMAYIKGEGKPTGPGKDEGCPFCLAPKSSDEESLIVARGDLVYAILNLYPYNAGHVLVCPYRHVADYTDLTGQETAEDPPARINPDKFAVAKSGITRPEDAVRLARRLIEAIAEPHLLDGHSVVI